MTLCVDFPKNGTDYLVHRVDDPRPTGAGVFNPSLSITLRPIPTEIDQADIGAMSALLCEPGGPHDITIRVPAGLGPNLRMGDIWRDGAFVGRGPWVERLLEATDPDGAATVTAEARGTYDRIELIGLSELLRRMVAANGADPALYKPVWVTAFRRGAEIIETPAWEVFRALLAPHSELALALMTGPWELTRRRLVDETALAEAMARGEPRWLPLRPSAPRCLAPFLFAMLHDPAWRGAANAFYATRLRAIEASKAAGYAPMTVTWPFDPASRRMRMRGFTHPSRPEVFFVLEILGYDWRGPDIIETPTALAALGPRPLGGVASDAVAATTGGGARFVSGDRLQLSALADPDDGATPAPLPTPMPELFGRPSVTPRRAAATRSRRRSGGIPTFVLGQPTTVRVIDPDMTPSWAARSQGPATRKRCDRFQEVLDVMAAARAVGGLRGFAVIPPPDTPQMSGDVPVWSCPEKRLTAAGRFTLAAWSRYRDGAGEVQRRAALVTTLTTRRGRSATAITLEIPESAQGQSFRDVLFPTPAGDRDAVVRRLLQFAVERRGVWSDAPDLAAELGLERLVLWTHRAHPRFVDGDPYRTRLSCKALMACIDRLDKGYEAPLAA